ncbi:MAG: DUF5668 domain-containing protein [Acidobacteriota bacterium]
MKDKKGTESGPWIVGSIFIVAGVLWVLRNFGKVDLNLREWWPLILIGVGLITMVNHKNFLSFSGWLLISLGGIFLLTTNNIVGWNLIWRFWPAVLIVIGLSIVLGHKVPGGYKSTPGSGKIKGSGDNRISGLALFSGFERVVTARSFKGGRITALFGGAEIDLKNAELDPNGASLELTALFGGIDIKIPEKWNIELHSSAVFGGVGNKTVNEHREGDKGMTISATALFGGIEIKN